MSTVHHQLASISRVLLGIVAAIAASHQAHAQSTIRGRPCEGQNGYVIRDAQTGQVVSRGWTTSSGSLPPDLVLGPNRPFTISVANGPGGFIGTAGFTTGPSGSITTIPRVQIGDSIADDSDGDGLNDDVEEVFGFDPMNSSTFGGGINDSVLASTPPPPGAPIGGGIVQNPNFGPAGIVNNVLLPGNSVDLFAFNDMLAVANLDRGVSIFNIFGGLSPRLISTIDTPGEARAVGAPFNLLPVADGAAGLTIINLTDPANPFISAQRPLGGFAQSVFSVGDIAYVGLRNGQLGVFDLPSGTEVQRLSLGDSVFDIGGSGDFLFAVSGNTLRSFSMNDGFLDPAGTLPLTSMNPDSFSGRKRLFVGGDWAYVAGSTGFDTIDLSNPAAMRLVGRAPTSGTVGSFKQIVNTGSGLGLAAVGVNPRAGGQHDITLYDVSDPTNVRAILTTFTTPGDAFSATIYNGLGFIADGMNGIDVLRFVETDRRGVAPVISLDTSAEGGQSEEGKLFRFTANAADDVLVRNVQFFLDGQQIANDGNFPFEIFFNSPLLTPATPSFALRARAFDMAGNSTWSDPLVINLTPDTTAPRVAGFQPANNSILGPQNSVAAFFSEPLLPSSLSGDDFLLVNAGLDSRLGTGDDFPATGGTFNYQDTLRAAIWSFSTPLPPGLWHATIKPPISDRAGNALAAPQSWNFYIFDQPDRDSDGVPDALEAALSLDPDNPVSRPDGMRDGERDFDNDGLRNSWEVFWQFDPRNARSRVATVLDGDLDLDLDSLLNRQEQSAGTNPQLADTDGDGWSDETEFTGQSDALDPASRPKLFVAANPVVRVIVPVFAPGEGIARNVTLAQPRVSIGLNGTQQLDDADRRVVLAQPPVRLGLPAFDSAADSFGPTLARPPVKIQLPQ